MATANFDKNKEFSLVVLIINAGLLAAHLALLVSFGLLHVTPMLCFNIVSVAFYLASFLFITHNHIEPYIILLVIEVTLHFVGATICVGWEAGFPLYCFGLISVIYYTKYIYIRKKLMRYIPLAVITTATTLFITLRLYSYSFAPLYRLDAAAEHGYFIANSVMMFIFIFCSLHNYTEVVIKSEDKLHQLADYDELTQVYTRRRIHEILNDYHRAAEKGRLNFCITIVDVDNFKRINDTFGHDAGDYVLKSICKKLKDALADGAEEHGTDIARWGGDEFLLVQKYAAATPEAEEAALDSCRHTIQRLHDGIVSARYLYDDTILPIGMTCGFAAHTKGSTINETFKTADENLYKGKLAGKNVVIF